MIIKWFKSNSVQLIFILIFLATSNNVFATSKCLYISSYHKGYAWSDGVEKGLRNELEEKCDLKQFDLDTKRNKSESYKKEIALKAKQLINSWQPDVVIVSDDNAAKYIIKPYFKDHSIPFVFCGINWNVEAYGFPYSNTTGMIEVAPIKPLFTKVNSITGQSKSAFYLGADTLTELKNLARFKKETLTSGITLVRGLAKSSEEWLALYKKAQAYDFIIMGSNSGINDWNKDTIQEGMVGVTSKLTVTNHQWMMPYTMLGLTKIPEEQGKWAAQAALYILKGTKPIEIPIVANRKWDIWLNENLIKQTTINVPASIVNKAKKLTD